MTCVAAVAVVEQRAEVAGGQQLSIEAAAEHQLSTTEDLTRQQKERRRKKENKKRRKKAALEHGDLGEMVQQLEGSQQESKGAAASIALSRQYADIRTPVK